MEITSIIVNADLSLTVVSNGETLVYVNQATVAQTEPATEVHVTEGEEIKVVEDDASQSTQSA